MGIAADSRHGPLVFIEGLREVPGIGHPERAIEPVLQGRRLGSQLICCLRVALTAEQVAHAMTGRVHIALHLYWSNWRRREGAIGKLQGVAAIFPYLVEDAALRGGACVFYQAIAVKVAV